VDREAALGFIRRELAAIHQRGLPARLLVPLTRPHGGTALQFEVEMESLDQFDPFRRRGVGSPGETEDWMREFSEVLTAPPSVETRRIIE